MQIIKKELHLVTRTIFLYLFVVTLLVYCSIGYMVYRSSTVPLVHSCNFLFAYDSLAVIWPDWKERKEKGKGEKERRKERGGSSKASLHSL